MVPPKTYRPTPKFAGQSSYQPSLKHTETVTPAAHHPSSTPQLSPVIITNQTNGLTHNLTIITAHTVTKQGYLF
jgi:hypothetical protein